MCSVNFRTNNEYQFKLIAMLPSNLQYPQSTGMEWLQLIHKYTQQMDY